MCPQNKQIFTCAEKQKLAGFIDLTGDFLTSGYKSEHKEYHFKDDSSSQSIKALNNSDTIESIKTEINTCMNCQLGNTRKNTVAGEGVNNPLVLVIGEGPGADEDTQGRPFVGKAGQLLDKMLASINLSRNTNCFIANVVKCRPPNNRDPYPEEAEACAHFLNRQISVLKPKFILLVGNIAARNLLKTSESVGNLRGKFTEYKTENISIPLLVTFTYFSYSYKNHSMLIFHDQKIFVYFGMALKGM